MDDEPGPDDLRRLVAHTQVEEVLRRYCRGVDRMDVDLVRSCYHADAVDHHGSFHGDREEFITWVWRLLGSYTMTMHYLANVTVELHPEHPDLARSETYGMAVHRTADAPIEKNLMVGFRYLDRFECRPADGAAGGVADGAAQWRIAYRVATTEWVKRVEPDEWWPVGPKFLTGSRDRTDPVYADWDAPHPGRPAG